MSATLTRSVSHGHTMQLCCLFPSCNNVKTLSMLTLSAPHPRYFEDPPPPLGHRPLARGRPTHTPSQRLSSPPPPPPAAAAYCRLDHPILLWVPSNHNMMDCWMPIQCQTSYPTPCESDTQVQSLVGFEGFRVLGFKAPGARTTAPAGPVSPPGGARGDSNRRTPLHRGRRTQTRPPASGTRPPGLQRGGWEGEGVASGGYVCGGECTCVCWLVTSPTQ